MTESDPAETVFAAWALRRESGEAADFEAVCAAHPQLERELRRLRANFERIEVPLADRRATSSASKDTTPSSGRYRADGEIGKGGMGAVYAVFDRELQRSLAMKVLIDNASVRLARFTEEARVTAQLDHPGIVPVHELGVDDRGHVFFTMKLVSGNTLAQVFDAVKRGVDGWNPTRALSVVLRVCEAMAFAHEKGVIHRDLKPSNIMVGRFGETYVMDWGLARVLGKKDTKDIRPRRDEGTSAERTPRREAAGKPHDSPLLTMDGDQVGTPAYMPPEQARGDLERIGPHSDVYAVGAILYHLLSGQVPYVEPDAHPTPQAILAQVQAGPPKPLHTLAKDVPAELLAICDKAMERDLKKRYPTMTEFADDLRAYLERRVVKAYETGAIAEMKKWVLRNKGLAAAAGVLLVVLVGATVVVANKNREVDHANVEITQQKSAVEAKSAEVSARKAEFDQLAGVVLLETALKKEEDLYPAWPHKLEAMEQWLANDAARLLAMKPALARTIADLESRALPQSDAEREADRTNHPKFAELERARQRATWLRARLAALAAATPAALPALPADLASKSAVELNEFAWWRIQPDFARRLFGEEPVALVAAQAAVAKIEAGDATAVLASTLDTLAWAYLANGRDAEARATSLRALELATDRKKADHAEYVRKIEQALAAWSGEAGAKALSALQSSIATLETEVSRRQTWTFADESQRFLHSTLTKLAADIDAFEKGAKAGVDQRVAWARRIDDLTQRHPNARVTWDDARTAVAKADGIVASTLYREAPIDLKPQIGLVPLGMNPVTKLWEFYDLRTACDLVAGQDPASVEIPAHRADGSIEMKDGTGIVFVLVPGGTFLQGAQKDDESAPNFDPAALADEAPQSVTLSPYFWARHELTKGQWFRMTDGDEPSWFRRGITYDMARFPIGWTHPVENVSWEDCALRLPRVGLSMPTEAQWEYGARGGTGTPWWTGKEASTLSGAANVFDQHAERSQPAWGRQEGDFDDGYVSIAPVGTFKANAFGLFDVHGNVWEWCADAYSNRYATPQAGDGLRSPVVTGPADRVIHGGNCNNAASYARSAYRYRAIPSGRVSNLGVRAARALD